MSVAHICLHNLDPSAIPARPDFKVVARTGSRRELRDAIGTLEIRVLVLDLDAKEALDAVVEAIELRPELAVIGVTGESDVRRVIAAQRAGCGQIATKPVDSSDIEAAIRKLIYDPSDVSDRSRTCGILGASGGTGVTAVACYLAVSLAEQTNQSTALIDLDFDFGNVAQAWDLCPTYTIADVASAGAVDTLILQRAAIDLPGGVHVLSRPATIAQGHLIDETLIANIIKTARSVYPNSVLDLPRKLDAVTGKAMEMCDKLVIVLQLTVPAVNNAVRLVEALVTAGLPPERVEFIVNRYRKNVHTLSIESVEKRLRRSVLGVIPNDYRAVAHAIDLGEPVSTKSPMRGAIAEIAGKLAGLHNDPPEPGWLSRFGLKRRKGADAPVPQSG